LAAELGEALLGGVECDRLVAEVNEAPQVPLLFLGVRRIAIAVEEGCVIARSVLVRHDG
jgi:hypothetical protein